MGAGLRAAPMATVSTLQLLPFLVTAMLVLSQRLPATVADNRGFSLRLVAASHHTDREDMVNVTTVGPGHPRPVVLPGIVYAYSVVVRFGTGSQEQDYALALDMAGSLTWMQCQPCAPVLPQDGPVYDPEHSRGYQHVAATDPLCGPPNPGAHPDGDKCSFHFPMAHGTLGTDTISLGSPDLPIRGFVFGCAATTSGFRNYGKFAGALGMGRPVPVSLLTRIADRAHSRFSYCLFEPDPAGQPGHSYLRFGADIPDRHYVHTAILPPQSAGESAYYVRLVGVSVNGFRLAVTPSMFARRGDGTGGCKVDAGTSSTWVAQQAYVYVEAAVLQAVQQRGGERVQRDDFRLCFRRLAPTQIPKVTLHLDGDGADLHLEGKRLFANVRDRARTRDDSCFVLMPSTDLTVIGSRQQVDTRFVFDLQRSRISFRPELCYRDGDNIPASRLSGGA